MRARTGSRPIRRALAALTLLMASAACGGADTPATPVDGPDVLRVLAGSEIGDLEPLLRRARDAIGVRIALSYAGTLDGADQSDVNEMRQIAQLTGGATFDARKGSLAAAFKEIRGYQ
ncbi:hypothetical protein ACFQVD_30005 [Streptosporangium amethystogenes subsp. fukuiense]|uniref:Uncharacterized protein n=1 Tax=Streptosporangium amethystogenes subsp. fukuiense TaxID=698418 RepID=A0ABW2T8P3_9ACTN